MIQIKILSGQRTGEVWNPRRFPIRLGRSGNSDLRLEESGVWDDHCRIVLDPMEGFVVESTPNTVVRVNSQPTARARLRNGDTIEMGSATIQFWLSAARQRRVVFREMFVWFLVAGIFAAQIALIYWLVTAA